MNHSQGRLTASVVIVTRNRPRQLSNLLKTLVRQTEMPDEVLIVNNASTVSYQEVIDAYSDKLPLRMVMEPQPGIPFARNRGIQEARGELILFTDDDVEVSPEWVAQLVRPFERDPDIAAVGGEILSEVRTGTLVEQFCVEESLMRVGRPKEQK